MCISRCLIWKRYIYIINDCSNQLDENAQLCTMPSKVGPSSTYNTHVLPGIRQGSTIFFFIQLNFLNSGSLWIKYNLEPGPPPAYLICTIGKAPRGEESQNGKTLQSSDLAIFHTQKMISLLDCLCFYLTSPQNQTLLSLKFYSPFILLLSQKLRLVMSKHGVKFDPRCFKDTKCERTQAWFQT